MTASRPLLSSILLTSALLTALLLSTGCASLLSRFSGPEAAGLEAGERSMGQWMVDKNVEATAAININKAHADFRNAHITVTSQHGYVLLTGQVPNAELKTLAEKTAFELAEVKHVYNELSIAEPVYYLTRSRDALATTRASNRLASAESFPAANRIRITTENRVLYLLGQVHRDEGSKAVELIKDVPGIDKIVKVFQYMEDTATTTAGSISGSTPASNSDATASGGITSPAEAAASTAGPATAPAHTVDNTAVDNTAVDNTAADSTTAAVNAQP